MSTPERVSDDIGDVGRTSGGVSSGNCLSTLDILLYGSVTGTSPLDPVVRLS